MQDTRKLVNVYVTMKKHDWNVGKLPSRSKVWPRTFNAVDGQVAVPFLVHMLLELNPAVKLGHNDLCGLRL